MKISVIIEHKVGTSNGKKYSFFAASAQGKYLLGVKGITTGADDLTYFQVKTPMGNSFPTTEGIYDVEVNEDDAWKDVRETVTRPTVWVRNATYTKKADLKKKA